MAEQDEWLRTVSDEVEGAAQEHPSYARDDLDELLGQFSLLSGGLAVTAEGRAAGAALASALAGALDGVAEAERHPQASRWDEALAAWEQAAVVAVAVRAALPPDGAAVVARAATSLALWVYTVGEIYCVLRLGLDPWAEITGHSSEFVIRRVEAIERHLLAAWGTNRYQLYTLLKRRYSHWSRLAARRGWISESDALDYMSKRARMRTLIAYLVGGRQSLAAGDTAGPVLRSSWRERLGVLGRLGVDAFYYTTAGFGYQPGRLLWVNGLVILGFGLLYWLGQLLLVPAAGGQVMPVPQTVSGLLQSEYFSALAFMLAALGEITPLNTLARCLIVLESTWGFLMISVVISTVINRNTANPA